MTQHGPRDVESVLAARYTLTDAGWEAAGQWRSDKIARLAYSAHALLTARPDLAAVPAVGTLLVEHVRWSA